MHDGQHTRLRSKAATFYYKSGAAKGVSGKKRSPTNCKAAGSAVAPNIQRHVPGTNEKAQLTRYDTKWPPVIMRTLADTSPARAKGLEHSVRNTGTAQPRRTRCPHRGRQGPDLKTLLYF